VEGHLRRPSEEGEGGGSSKEQHNHHHHHLGQPLGMKKIDIEIKKHERQHDEKIMVFPLRVNRGDFGGGRGAADTGGSTLLVSEGTFTVVGDKVDDGPLKLGTVCFCTGDLKIGPTLELEEVLETLSITEGLIIPPLAFFSNKAGELEDLLISSKTSPRISPGDLTSEPELLLPTSADGLNSELIDDADPFPFFVRSGLFILVVELRIEALLPPVSFTFPLDNFFSKTTGCEPLCPTIGCKSFKAINSFGPLGGNSGGGDGGGEYEGGPGGDTIFLLPSDMVLVFLLGELVCDNKL
jgi:hypothetical protein